MLKTPTMHIGTIYGHRRDEGSIRMDGDNLKFVVNKETGSCNIFVVDSLDRNVGTFGKNLTLDDLQTIIECFRTLLARVPRGG